MAERRIKRETQQQSSDWQRWLPWAISAATLIGLGVAAAKYLSGPKVIAALQDFDYRYAAPVLVLSALYLWLKALRFGVLLRPFTKLPLGQLTRAYFAGQPATFLPGGIATRAALFHQLGVPAPATAVPILHSSLFDQLMFVLTTLIAALWFPSARPVAVVLLGVLAVFGGVLLIAPARIWLGQRLRAIARHFEAELHWDTFVNAFDKVNNWQTLAVTFALSVLSFVVPVVMLSLILNGLGERLSLPVVFLAYAVANMAARVTPVPGGLGLTEGGMVGMLSSVGDVTVNTAAAAAALHRIGDSFFQALLGALVYFLWWRGKDEARDQTAPQRGKTQPQRSKA